MLLVTVVILSLTYFASFSSLGGHNEQENTLNQLLVEMDGELIAYFIVFCIIIFCNFQYVFYFIE